MAKITKALRSDLGRVLVDLKRAQAYDMIAHKGVWYCRTEQGARDLMRTMPLKSEPRIVEYTLGFAVQAGPSGGYMGPDCLNPKPWRGYKGV